MVQIHHCTSNRYTTASTTRHTGSCLTHGNSPSCGQAYALHWRGNSVCSGGDTCQATVAWYKSITALQTGIQQRVQHVILAAVSHMATHHHAGKRMHCTGGVTVFAPGEIRAKLPSHGTNPSLHFKQVYNSEYNTSYWQLSHTWQLTIMRASVCIALEG